MPSEWPALPRPTQRPKMQPTSSPSYTPPHQASLAFRHWLPSPPIVPRCPRTFSKPHQPKDAHPKSTDSNELRFWSTNPNSLEGKRYELVSRIVDAQYTNSEPHVISISETKFGPEHEGLISGYELFRRDRATGLVASGGVYLYIREDLVSTDVEVDQLNSDAIEQIWRVVHVGKDAFSFTGLLSTRQQ